MCHKYGFANINRNALMYLDSKRAVLRMKSAKSSCFLQRDIIQTAIMKRQMLENSIW